MASIKAHKDGWRAFVCKAGVRLSKVFASKARAVAWATHTEATIMAGARGEVPDKTFGDLLERYRDEVSVSKRGQRWESLRIGLVMRDPIAAVKLRKLDVRAVAAWRDRRLAQVSAASVRREWTLLSHACTIAVREWRWLKDNPMREVRRPPPAKARDRIGTEEEIERLLHVMGYDRAATPTTATARVGAAMLFAIETAMRAGEIVTLTWPDVRADKRYLTVRDGKTAAARRDVPLSPEALRILSQMPKDSATVFDLTSAQIDALFRNARARALVDDLHFHDMRHLAITRLAKKLDVLALARMVGHRDLRMLQVYYNAPAEELAARLG